eukprot:GHVR01145945.1.p1 GENE.GHVR01145945.1~~GHVR01145945.1.p1  ORF type:complete len:103 (-),score=11.03 GHVR01145945.1:461-769(-)
MNLFYFSNFIYSYSYILSICPCSMTRKLKHHEQKLLKKTDILSWKSDNKKEHKLINKYYIQNREDYTQYTLLCGKIAKTATSISLLNETDTFRGEMARNLIK